MGTLPPSEERRGQPVTHATVSKRQPSLKLCQDLFSTLFLEPSTTFQHSELSVKVKLTSYCRQCDPLISPFSLQITLKLEVTLRPAGLETPELLYCRAILMKQENDL